MKEEPEIIYKRRGIKVPILWEKTYYSQNLIDESRTLQGKETGKWQGIAFLYRFLILQGTTKNRFRIEQLIESYVGENQEEMVDALEKLVDGKEEWVLEGKHFKNANFFPDEVNQKLLKFNLQKYVKKVS